MRLKHAFGRDQKRYLTKAQRKRLPSTETVMKVLDHIVEELTDGSGPVVLSYCWSGTRYEGSTTLTLPLYLLFFPEHESVEYKLREADFWVNRGRSNAGVIQVRNLHDLIVSFVDDDGEPLPHSPPDLRKEVHSIKRVFLFPTNPFENMIDYRKLWFSDFRMISRMFGVYEIYDRYWPDWVEHCDRTSFSSNTNDYIECDAFRQLVEACGFWGEFNKAYRAIYKKANESPNSMRLLVPILVHTLLEKEELADRFVIPKEMRGRVDQMYEFTMDWLRDYLRIEE